MMPLITHSLSDRTRLIAIFLKYPIQLQYLKKRDDVYTSFIIIMKDKAEGKFEMLFTRNFCEPIQSLLQYCIYDLLLS